MQTRHDKATVDLTRTRAEIVPGVQFRPQVHQSETFYHVMTVGTSQYYRIGCAEYVFLSVLDGRTTFSEALALTARALGATALLQNQATSLYQWALESGIIRFAETETQRQQLPDSKKTSQLQWLQKLNPLWFRVPFGRPDALLKLLEPYLGRLFSPAAVAVSLLLMMAALM
ncbi:MAG: hypothetical protein KDA89_14415, partial [Planctomycetaceae bacterium]|nr:hypothetical protein [Planctomycetaceae bacterium]